MILIPPPLSGLHRGEKFWKSWVLIANYTSSAYFANNIECFPGLSIQRLSISCQMRGLVNWSFLLFVIKCRWNNLKLWLDEGPLSFFFFFFSCNFCFYCSKLPIMIQLGAGRLRLTEWEYLGKHCQEGWMQHKSFICSSEILQLCLYCASVAN